MNQTDASKGEKEFLPENEYSKSRCLHKVFLSTDPTPTKTSSKHPRYCVRPQLTCPVFFIGFMGAGKTSLARKLARICGAASVDLDTYLERREGRRIKDLFDDAGEEEFRALESDVLRELSEKEPLLVSCGGGIVLSQANRILLKQRGFVVHLLVTADEAASRISDLSTRPLFCDLAQARRTIDHRLPLYKEVADAVVNTSGKSVSAIAYEVRALLEREGILWRQK